MMHCVVESFVTLHTELYVSVLQWWFPEEAKSAGQNDRGQLGVGGTADVLEPQSLQVSVPSWCPADLSFPAWEQQAGNLQLFPLASEVKEKPLLSRLPCFTVTKISMNFESAEILAERDHGETEGIGYIPSVGP